MKVNQAVINVFSAENKEISPPPPQLIDDWRLLIKIYKFYENWSTETFRKQES